DADEALAYGRQMIDRLVDAEDLSFAGTGIDGIEVERPHGIAPPSARFAQAVHDNRPHHAGRVSHEMRAVADLDPRALQKPDVGFVDKDGGAEQRSGAAPMHPGMSQAAQLRVELGEELAARALVAAIRRGEQPGDITHPTSEGSAVADRNDRGRQLCRIKTSTSARLGAREA